MSEVGVKSASRLGRKVNVDKIQKAIMAKLNISGVKFHAVKDQKDFSTKLLDMEFSQVVFTYKFGVLYCTTGQTTESSMYNNVKMSAGFETFLEFLGKKVQLQGWTEYRGGLDVHTNTTGTHSIYTTLDNSEIMFHVSTFLPYSSKDPQQLERKRHLGNDIVLIIYKEGTELFDPKTMNSEFNHVFIVVQPVSASRATEFYVQTVSKSGVGQINPPTCEGMYKLDNIFRLFLLRKMINAERAAYKAPVFAQKIARTKALQIQHLAEGSM
eukprot:TRINITY_DN7929_c0_g2_i2.p1 TRINITY_DN7929_c0_g2~~TRINITY_DN7929_c0_g2_i2.p1  ORF type:complete len:281 (-),score=46.76 TRINITY_DN7929_c0_g2_i2:43-849(-)